MAAGLYIHILDEIDDQLAGALGASCDVPFVDLGASPAADGSEGLTGRLGMVPRVFVGEGPWGADASDGHALPTPLARIRETVASGPSEIDDNYVARIMVPFDRVDETPYRLGRPGEIWRFLRHHEGKRALLVIHPDETKVAAEPDAITEAAAATDEATVPSPEPPPEPVHHDPAFRRAVPTIDGVRPLALVLVTTQQRAPGPASLRERILATLATIGTFGAGLAAGAGLNNLIR